jgi:hypothetical protein
LLSFFREHKEEITKPQANKELAKTYWRIYPLSCFVFAFKLIVFVFLHSGTRRNDKAELKRKAYEYCEKLTPKGADTYPFICTNI